VFAVGLATLAVLCSAAIGYQITRSSLQRQIEERLQLLAAERQARMRAFVNHQYERITLVTSRTQLRTEIRDFLDGLISREAFLAATSQILSDALTATVDFREISVADDAGEVIASTFAPRLQTSVRDLLAFQHGRDRPFLSEPQRDTQGLWCWLSGPSLRADGSTQAVILVRLSADDLQRILWYDDDEENSSFAFLIAREEQQRLVYLLPGSAPVETESNAASFPVMQRAIRGESGFGRTRCFGRDVLAAWSPVHYQQRGLFHWGMVALIDTAEAFQPIDRFRWLVAELLLGIVLASAGIAYFGARRLTGPLHQLMSASQSLARGEAIGQLDVRREDEVGLLARTFNQMANELTRSHQNLEQRAGVLADAKSRLEEELLLAQQVQRYLYPQSAPQVAGLDVAGLSVPAEMLCGDYYDFVVLESDRLVFAVGDVSGHGAGPALLMVEIRAALRSLAMREVPFAEWLPHLNRLMCQDSSAERFVSLFVGEVNLRRRELRYFGAGHNAWLVGTDREVRQIPSTSVVLGLIENICPEGLASVEVRPLAAGDVMLIPTDGIHETQSSSRELYGQPRLEQILQAHCEETAEQLLQALQADVLAFRGAAPQKDDLTAVVVKIL
jgi:sigma-B regulation protein RsbU (phosphoserine phosphatase)